MLKASSYHTLMYDLNLAIVIAKHGQILFVANNDNTELASI